LYQFFVKDSSPGYLLPAKTDETGIYKARGKKNFKATKCKWKLREKNFSVHCVLSNVHGAGFYLSPFNLK